MVVTLGGGGDGFEVMDNYLSMLQTEHQPMPFKSILVTGPFMPAKSRKRFFRRANRLNVKAYRFYHKMEGLMAAADLVVSMGGYNTVCEILSQGTVSLVIPRETPRKEQLIRAKVLHNQHLLDYIKWDNLSPRILRDKILALLDNPEIYQEAISRFQLTGFKAMRRRLDFFRNNKT